MIRRKAFAVHNLMEEKKSVTFDPSGLLKMLSMNGTERQGISPDHTPGNKTSLDESIPKQHGRKIERTEGCDTTDNSLTSGDNPDLLGLPVQSTSSTPEGRRPKGIKYWLKDPNVYMVNPHDSNYPCLLIQLTLCDVFLVF